MIDIDVQEFHKLKRILSGISTISKASMIEQSSKAGNKTRVAVRKAFLASTTEWTQDYVNGRRVIRQNNGSLNQVLGIRIAHRKGGGIDNPASMANHITSVTSEATGTTVIAAPHKRWNPPKIRNGKIIGKVGQVDATSRATIAILEKLNYGDLSGDNAKHFKWSNGKKSYRAKKKDNKAGMTYTGDKLSDGWKPRHFIETGWNNVKGQVITDMTTTLANMIGKRVNNMNLSKVKDVV